MLVSGACGFGGVCLTTTATYTRNTAPRITLNTTIIPATFKLPYGFPFSACFEGISRRLDEPCEPGASAIDLQDGNVGQKVVACPSAACQANASLCAGMQCD